MYIIPKAQRKGKCSVRKEKIALIRCIHLQAY